MEGKIEHRSTLQPLLIGLAAGMVVGGILGILFAPRSGKETRQKVGDITHRLREKVAGHPAEVHFGSGSEN